MKVGDNMANGFNKGRYLLPTINYIEKRVMLLESRFRNNTPNWAESYSIAAETLDIKDLIADLERLRLTFEEREFLKETKRKLDNLYKKAHLIMEL